MVLNIKTTVFRLITVRYLKEIVLFAFLSKIGMAFYKILINKFNKVILIHITGWFGLQTLYNNTFQRRMM